MADKKNETGIVQFPLKKNSGRPGIAFGKTLREFRLRAQLEQEQLGRACGVSGNTISNWERDVSRPDISMVPTLCRLLNMTLYSFYGMDDPNSFTNEEKGLMSDYRYMTEPNKRQLRKVAAAIIESQEETRKEGYRQNFCYLTGHDRGLAAGFGAPLDDEPDTYPIFVRISRDACRSDDIFPVNGQSMEPEYPDGSLVFVQHAEADELSFGDVIACIASGTPYVKIYEKDGLHSINPDYDVIHISDDDNMRLIGRVVGIVPEGDLATKEETEELLEIFAEELK